MTTSSTISWIGKIIDQKELIFSPRKIPKLLKERKIETISVMTLVPLLSSATTASTSNKKKVVDNAV